MRYRLGRLLLRPSSQSLFFSRRTLLRVLHSPSCKAECSDYTPGAFLEIPVTLVYLGKKLFVLLLTIILRYEN